MANFQIRSIDDIFQELLLEKQNLTALNDLNSDGITDENSLITALDSGKVPDWVLWLYNMSVSTNITDVATFTAVTEIDDKINNQIAFTAPWYIDKAKAFQYTDTVVVDPITYQVGYSTINTANQIIASCTTREFSNKLILKVRRSDTDILSVDEKNAFESYMFKVKAAGTQLEVQNFAADELTLNMTILYNGNISLGTIQTNVEAAINDYINNIEFDSKFITSSLINNLQNLDGIVDPRFDSASALDSLGVTTSFVHEYLSNAGYMTINSLTPLSGTITYVAK